MTLEELDLEELVGDAGDELDDLLLELVTASILNQLILKPEPRVNAVMANVCSPAVKGIVCTTLTHFCDPPVLGTATVS